MTSIIWYFFFENSTTLLGETGLTITVFGWSTEKADLTNSLVVNSQTATEIGGGIYAYRYASGTPKTHDYLAVGQSSSGDVVSKQVPALRWDGAEAWSTELAYLDAAISTLATAVALAVVDGNVDDILVDTSTTLPAQIAELLLKNSATAAASGVDGSDLTLTNKLTFSETISNLTIPATWQKAYVTVKEDLDDPDSEAILQVLVSATPDAANDGITYVNKVAATAAQRLYGSLVVNQSAGTILWNVKDDMTFTNTTRKYTYDVKFLITGSDSEKPAGSANFTIKATETKTV